MITYGNLRPLPTEAESYKDGRKTGRAWTYNYTPGGPWVAIDHRCIRGSDWADWCAQTATNNAAWLAGFRRGCAERGA